MEQQARFYLVHLGNYKNFKYLPSLHLIYILIICVTFDKLERNFFSFSSFAAVF